MSWRSAYLRQAQSDWVMFNRLTASADTPLCQRLHYLQMATEKLAKGLLTVSGGGPYPKTHDAFVRFMRVAKSRPDIREACKFTQASAFNAYIDSLLPLGESIQGLSPEGDDHPNPEYPWELREIIYTPVDYAFPEFALQSRRMLKMLQFLQYCFLLTPTE